MAAPTGREDDGIRGIIEREMSTLRLTYGREATPISSSSALSACASGALKDKVVVVTGGTKGFGRAFAVKAAVEFGARVVVAARGAKGVEETVEEIRRKGGQATGKPTDVTSWGSQVALFEHAVKTFGPIDVVIANAGIFEGGVLLEDKLDEEGKLTKPDMSTIDINMVGTIYTSKLAFHHLLQNPSTSLKSLVILGSLTSYIPSPGCPLYVAAKHGLLGLQRALSLEAKDKGIDVTFVASAPVPTEIFGDLLPMIQNLPHGSLDDTVNAMLAASSIPGLNGKVYATDTKGIFQVPFRKALEGEERERPVLFKAKAKL